MVHSARKLGATDCEAFRSGLFAQPVNTVSSLAFLAVGGAIIAWGLRQPRGHRMLPAIYGAAVAANFVGGVLYHGPAWSGSAWFHDLAIVAPLLFIVLFDVAALRPTRTLHLLGVGALVLALAGMILAGLPQSANAISAVLAALVLGLELAAAPERYTHRKARQAYAVVIGALLVGVLANVLGRTGGPLCRGQSPLQGHALWHLCTAIAMGGWGVAAFAMSRRPAAPSRVVGAPASV